MGKVNIKPVKTVAQLSPQKQNKVKSTAASQIANDVITRKERNNNIIALQS